MTGRVARAARRGAAAFIVTAAVVGASFSAIPALTAGPTQESEWGMAAELLTYFFGLPWSHLAMSALTDSALQYGVIASVALNVGLLVGGWSWRRQPSEH